MKELLKDLTAQIKSGSGSSTTRISRSFVRYYHPEAPTGEVFVGGPRDSASLSVIIPTSDADRGGYFTQLLEQISDQDLIEYEVIIVKGDARQGRAINVGAALARGKYLLTLDDDTSLPDIKTFSKLSAVMDDHPDIGMAGGNNVIPEDASPFVREVMKQIPRRSWTPVLQITDSDLAEHPCLIMRTDDFKAAGGENELIPRGLDPYLRQEFRKLGKRVVLIPGVIYHHLPPASWSRLLRQFYRNGQQAAFVNRYYPQWMIETPAGHGAFEARRPFVFRFFRFACRLFNALVTGKSVFFLCEAVYAAGFISEVLNSSYNARRNNRKNPAK